MKPRRVSAAVKLLLIIAFFGAVSAIFAQNPAREAALTLDETLRRLAAGGEKASLRWDPFFAQGVITLAGHRASFGTGAPGEGGDIIVDSKDLLAAPAPYLENGALRFPESFVQALKRAFDARMEDDRSRLRIAAIIIDPGHGGRDPGAIGNLRIGGRQTRIEEKEIALRAARILYGRLRAAYPEKRILMTREGDTFPTLDDRVNLANSVALRENEAIVYVSLHANASYNPDARGFEVWYLNPEYRRNLVGSDEARGNADVLAILNDMRQDQFITESIMIARAINLHVGAAMGRTLPSRGIKPEEWFVVRNARMPSVLVELGFVTNLQDAEIMMNEESLRNLVEAVYNGIADYIGTFESSGGFTLNQ